MPSETTSHIQARGNGNVRIGPVSVITLIVVICMAVLAVLAASTSHASAAISERQAEGSQMLYINELAGQEFVASVDDILAGVRAAGGTAADGARAVERGLDGVCANAREAAGGRVECFADVDGATVTAEFTCEDTRQLSIAITIREDASYRIEQWKMASVQQAVPSAGQLWTGA